METWDGAGGGVHVGEVGGDVWGKEGRGSCGRVKGQEAAE